MCLFAAVLLLNNLVFDGFPYSHLLLAFLDGVVSGDDEGSKTNHDQSTPVQKVLLLEYTQYGD